MQSQTIERVLYYFEEISKIPHGSYNIDKISDYLVSFAKSNQLKYIQDEYKNVIIYKDATEGYENSPVVVIQGHMDMVAVKRPECSKDMMTEGLELMSDGTYIYAKDTSLGADDGIAVAYGLAILESKDIPHPALEVVITTNEEVGMNGAIGIDPANIKGRLLLNIDSEEEGILTVGCAGGTRVDALIENDGTLQNGEFIKISISGLTGGHSGTMIHLGHANANVLMGRILDNIRGNMGVNICSLSGGEKTNAIATFADSVIKCEDNDKALKIIKDMAVILKEEYNVSDEDMIIEGSIVSGEYKAASKHASDSCINILLDMPDGVISFDKTYRELVDTSLNIGVVKYEDSVFNYSYEIRSSVRSKMNNLVNRVKNIANLCGAKTVEISSYPEWQVNDNSKLTGIMSDVYTRMFGKNPRVEVVHAGLECGILSSKLEGLDAVSFGPDILNIHTYNEKLDIKSVQRTYDYIKEVLAVLK